VQHMLRWSLVIVVDVCVTAANVSAQGTGARLAAMTFEGEVIAASSHWVDGGSRIVTEATVQTSDGQDVIVSQLGGSVDGIGMITLPGPPILSRSTA
jgi:hypothetical protein